MKSAKFPIRFPKLRTILLGSLVAAFASIFLTSLWYFSPANESDSNWGIVLGHYGIICFTWAFLLIFIWPVINLFDWNRKRLFLTLFLFFVVGVLFSLAHFGISRALVFSLDWLIQRPAHADDMNLQRIIGIVHSNLLLFTVLASICVAVSFVQRYQERELRESKLESKLTAAQLSTLKTQLQPHFLFNSLNAIAALVRDQPEVAETMIVKLSDLLRATLENVEQDEHPLSAELVLSRRFLEIELMRFGDRMEVVEEVDENVELALVPTLLLQPLLENAIGHGVAHLTRPCAITIQAMQNENWLHLKIANDVSRSPENSANGTGVGLQNTRDRLACLYGDDFQFKAKLDDDGHVFTVSIEIPLRFETAYPREAQS